MIKPNRLIITCVLFPDLYPFNTTSPIQEKSPELVFPTDVSSASLLRLGQPAAAVLTSEAEQGLKACKLTDPADLATAEDPTDASARLQAEQMQTGYPGHVSAPGMNRCSISIVPWVRTLAW